MPNYEVGDTLVNLTNPKTGDTVKTTFCSECEEGTLVVQEQESRYGHEYYLECEEEDCGACFYPVR